MSSFRFYAFVLLVLLMPIFARADIALQKNDVVAILGGGNTVEMMEAGYFETMLSASHSKLNLKFKDFSWVREFYSIACQRIDVRWRSKRNH